MDTVKSLQAFKILRFTFLTLTTITLAKLGLSLSDIGIYETLFFIGASFTWFWVNGLMNGLLPIYPDLNFSEKKVFLFNVFLLISGLSVIVAAVLWGFRGSIIPWLTNYTDLPFLEWYCLFIIINLPTYLIEYIYLLKEKPYHILGFGIYAFGGQFLVFFIPLLLGQSLEFCFIALFLLGISKYIWLLIILIKNSSFKIDYKLISPYLILSLPLVGYAFIGGLMDYIDGVIVSKVMDEEQFALYRNGARELPISLAVFTALSLALVPLITKDLAEGLAQLKRRSLRLMHPLFLLSIALMFLSPILFPLVFRAEFEASSWVFNIFLLILISRVLMPQTIVLGLKKTKILLIATSLEIITNLILSLIFIQFWGLEGIAMATIIAFTLEKIILSSYCYFYLKIPFHNYVNVNWYAFYSVLLILSYITTLLIY